MILAAKMAKQPTTTDDQMFCSVYSKADSIFFEIWELYILITGSLAVKFLSSLVTENVIRIFDTTGLLETSLFATLVQLF